jgi:hypothetical protein
MITPVTPSPIAIARLYGASNAGHDTRGTRTRHLAAFFFFFKSNF